MCERTRSYSHSKTPRSRLKRLPKLGLGGGVGWGGGTENDPNLNFMALNSCKILIQSS